NADVIASREDMGVIFIECKRVKSPGKVAVNIKNANEQIRRRINQCKSNKCKGLVAINLTDVLNKENKVFLARNFIQIKKESSDALNGYVLGLGKNIESGIHKKSLGV